MSSRLIGSGLSDCLSSPVRAKVECCKSCDLFSCRVKDCTATRIPSSSIMGCHSRSTGSLVGGWGLLLCRGAVSVFYSLSREGKATNRYSAFPQSTSITGTSPSDCLVSYPGHSLGRSYPSAEKQSVYSAAPANWAIYLTGYILIWTM